MLFGHFAFWAERKKTKSIVLLFQSMLKNVGVGFSFETPVDVLFNKKATITNIHRKKTNSNVFGILLL